MHPADQMGAERGICGCGSSVHAWSECDGVDWQRTESSSSVRRQAMGRLGLFGSLIGSLGDHDGPLLVCGRLQCP